ncbi:hypothetical protein QG516_05245 [Pedobacter gandavensis]|uniref:hypothetical protein n=2 Tax=Pedobacter TaxID=84567 RepID=UPI00247AA833|nr:hypothetical protein [Pedobacter gandavensis]WGQ11060.1 hypothetical protein QG516_05245 [Pedobacter gandavensis]
MCTFAFMKTNLFLIAVTLLLAFSACNKVSESIQRDVIIKPDTILISIPPMLVNRDSVVIKNLPTTVNIQAAIADLGGENFSVNNIQTARLSNFSFTYVPKVKDSVSVKNNFSNIGSVRVNLVSSSKTDSLAKFINTSSVDAISTNFGLTQVMDKELLKSYLNDGGLTYTMVIKPRKSITDTIKAKISASYTLTLSK